MFVSRSRDDAVTDVKSHGIRSEFLIIFSFYKVDADKWWPGWVEALIMPYYEVPGVRS